MATIVRDRKTNEDYILIGSGLGMYQSKKPNWFFGNLISDTSSGKVTALCVCDKYGSVKWIKSAQVSVISVDGKKPDDLI